MFRGLVIPACLAGYGVYCLVAEAGFIVGGMGSLRLFDGAATALAISCLGLAAFFHFGWFWRDRRILWMLAEFGQAAGLLVWLISWAYIIWYVALR